MTTTFTTRAAKLVLAAIATLGLFAGTNALASHQYHVAAAAQPTTVAVQYVTIVGHRNICFGARRPSAARPRESPP